MLLLVILVVVIVVFYLAAGNSTRNLPDYSKTKTFKLGEVTTTYSSLYQCAKNVLDYSFFSHDNYETRVLEEDLFFVIDGLENDIYVYTPHYAGGTQMETSKEGLDIAIEKSAPKGVVDYTSPEGEHIKTVNNQGRYQYNLRIPYSPTKSESGFYYFTVNESRYNGKYDPRVNYPPRFLSGPAQDTPDFSDYKSNGPITITSYPTEVSRHFSLEIEDDIWKNPENETVGKSAQEILVQTVASKLGAAKNQLLRYGGEAVFNEIVVMCTDAANELGYDTLLEAIQIEGM